MRRKLFFVVITLIVFIFVLENTGVLATVHSSELKYDTQASYRGKVIKIQHKVSQQDAGNNSSSYDSEGEGSTYKFVVKLESGSKILLNYYGDIEGMYSKLYGSDIQFFAKIQRPAGQRNPNCFDYAKYLKSVDIEGTATVESFKEIAKASNPIELFNKYLLIEKEKFIEVLPQSSKGLICGLLFGDTEYLDESVYEEFKANGTTHVLAVSGLHIGVIYGIIVKLLGRKQSKLTFGITIFMLIAFGFLASWNSSVVRAIGMVVLRMIALYTDRRYDLLTGAGFIALISILYNPYVIFNAGFQMSYLAIASISFFMPHIPDKIPDFAAVTIAVNIGLIPYQMYVFNTVSLTTFIANIPVVYVTTLMMPFVVIRFILNLAGLSLVPLNLVTDSLASFAIKINSWATLGQGSLDVTSPSLAILILIYIILFFVASETFEILRLRKEYRRLSLIFAAFAGICIAVSALTYEPLNDADIVFVDVGQGDCIHLSVGEADVLIDGGGSTNYEVGNKTLKPYLLKNGVRKVDLALATHTHTDHYKGLEELVDENMVEEIKTGLTAGSEFKSDKFFIETIWPLDLDSDEEQDKNENCSVFMIHYEGYKILITGDLDSQGETKMIEYYKSRGELEKLKADILKVGHHGSRSSTSNEFLSAVKPKFAVIQVGRNTYGHPTKEVLERLKAQKITIFRNDEMGAVGFDLSKNIEPKFLK